MKADKRRNNANSIDNNNNSNANISSNICKNSYR